MKRTTRTGRAHKRKKLIKRFPTTLKNMFMQFKIGERVLIKIDSSVPFARPPIRVVNTTGIITKVVNKTLDKIYVVQCEDKQHIIHAIHLRHYDKV